MDYPSSIRMHASLFEWLPFYEDPKFTMDLREQLQGLSRSTLERMLRGIRASTKGLTTTQSALLKLKSQVPITSNDFSSSRPGMVQADTVAHCGTSAAGPFISSLKLSDLATGWTENRALPNKTGL